MQRKRRQAGRSKGSAAQSAGGPAFAARGGTGCATDIRSSCWAEGLPGATASVWQGRMSFVRGAERTGREERR
jgi:hypothetical protein